MSLNRPCFIDCSILSSIWLVSSSNYSRVPNPLLTHGSTGFDGCKDTQVEILHVFQLAMVKYLLIDFMESLTDS